MNKRNSLGLIGINCCFAALSIFVGIFLVARVYVFTGYDIVAVGVFMLLNVLMIFVFFAISSYICKRIDAIWMIRVATVVVCLFLILTLYLGDELQNHYVLFGLLWGTGQGLFWGAMNYLISQVSKKGSLSFFVYLNISWMIVGIIFPFTLGAAIDWGSFFLTASFVLGIGILQLVFSFFIRLEKPESCRMRLREYFAALKEKGHLRASWGLFIVVATAGVLINIDALLSILIIMVHGSNLSIGVLGTIFSLVGVVYLFVYNRAKKGKGILFFIGGAMPLIGGLSLFFGVNEISLIIFYAGAVLRTVVETEENALRLNAPKVWGGEQFAMESNLFYEFAFVCGRIVACTVLILVGLLGASEILLVLMICASMAIFALHSYLLSRWKRAHSKS